MAAPRPTVQVEGGRALRKAMKDAGVSIADLKAAHAQAAQVVAHAAQGKVPTLTGRLRSTIRPSGTASAAIVRAGGARVPYANAIHWGWSRHNIAPTLFLTGPAEATEPHWSLVYMQALEAIIAEVERTADGTGA